MKYNERHFKIVEHIRPWEIDMLERQLHLLIQAKTYQIVSDNIVEIMVRLDMNTEFISEFTIPKDYFVSKFKYLESLTADYFKVDFKIVDGSGINYTRREAIFSDYDYLIYLDPDLYFSVSTLGALITSTYSIEDDKFMVTPTIIKYWDSSWDVITHPKFISAPYNMRDNFDVNLLQYSEYNSNDLSITVNKNIKFGGGWFNLFSKEMIELFPPPESFGGYGPDDTYIMYCARFLNIPQYILRGPLVTELTGRIQGFGNYIKDSLKFNDFTDKTRPSHNVLDTEIKKFYNNYIGNK